MLSHFSNKTEVVEKVDKQKAARNDNSKMKEEFDKFVATHKGQLDMYFKQKWDQSVTK
jgi:hypothetical protein